MRWTVRRMMVWVAAVGLLMGGLIALAPSQQTNCGGNSAALHDVHTYLAIVEPGAATANTPPFNLATATPDQRETLARIANDFWIRPARFLVAPLPCRVDPSSPRQVLIVCERPFRNVPRRLVAMWLNPPTHAAAYSDGTTGLISVAEFEALHRSKLVYLDEVLAAPPSVPPR